MDGAEGSGGRSDTTGRGDLGARSTFTGGIYATGLGARVGDTDLFGGSFVVLTETGTGISGSCARNSSAAAVEGLNTRFCEAGTFSARTAVAFGSGNAGAIGLDFDTEIGCGAGVG